MPEGETGQTCKEHIEVLKKEMACKTNRNMAVVKELIALTFAYRRTTFLKGTMSVGKCLESYPALKLPSTVSCSSLKFYKIGTKLFYVTYLILLLRDARTGGTAAPFRLLARRASWDAPRTNNGCLWMPKFWGEREIIFNYFPKYINISETK
jgi:hypothetical protein